MITDNGAPKQKLIAVCGPTASGKTALAAELAKILNGEIISADSVQIYKELNIGAAKPTAAEISAAPHFMIDILSVKSDIFFSAADYVKLAKECARDISARGKLPIVCGGTGLYMDSFIYNTQFIEHSGDAEYRIRLEPLSGAELHDMLSAVDPKSAFLIHPNNKKRLIRALEIYKITGKTKSEQDEQSRLAGTEYDIVKFELFYRERDTLYSKINKRVDDMFESGLLEEVKNLLEYKDNIKKIGAIGYVELFDYFDGVYTFEQAAQLIKQNTRNYAKRQITWFKRDKNTYRVTADEQNLNEITEICLKNI